MSQMHKPTFAGYIPVIHKGYLDAFERHKDSEVAVFDHTITQSFDYLRKDIRSLQPEQVVNLLGGIGITAFTINLDDLNTKLAHEESIIMPDDEISHILVNSVPHLLARVAFEPVFLRWDRSNTNIDQTVAPDKIISANDLRINIVSDLYQEAGRSSDWWRHVAAGIIADDTLTLSHNRAIPHQYINSIEGDPRITARRGEDIDKSLFIHAEADLIARMAKEGISTMNKDIFVTTFPCPNCARLIASSGFKSCYFIEGYAMLDGQRILNEAGVEIIKINTDVMHHENQDALRPYPEKPTHQA